MNAAVNRSEMSMNASWQECLCPTACTLLSGVCHSSVGSAFCLLLAMLGTRACLVAKEPLEVMLTESGREPVAGLGGQEGPECTPGQDGPQHHGHIHDVWADHACAAQHITSALDAGRHLCTPIEPRHTRSKQHTAQNCT